MVVDRVIRATGELLGEVGYAALRIEDVAVRSGVNKTTIYRRWPTRAELVAATMRKLKVPADRPRAERLRDEVLDYTREIFAFHASPEGRGMVRVIQLEQSHPSSSRSSESSAPRRDAPARRWWSARSAAGSCPRARTRPSSRT